MWSEFTEFIDHLAIEKGSAERTIDTRQRHLHEFSGFLEDRDVGDIEAVNRRDISEYVDALVEEGYAPKTIESRYASVSAAFNYCYQERVIDDNPIDRIERQAIKRKARKGLSESEKKAELGAKDHLSREEVYELAEHAPDPTDRNDLLIKLLFWTGLRVSEVVRIDIGEDGTLDGPGSDVFPDVPKIEAFGLKGDEPRVVSYPSEDINPLLRDYVSHGRLRFKAADDTQRLFVGRKGATTESGVGRVVDHAAQNMGIQEVKKVSSDGREYKRVTPHLLRHSHAMHFHNEEDVPLDVLKDHLGHSSVETTESFYAETTAEKMVETFGN